MIPRIGIAIGAASWFFQLCPDAITQPFHMQLEEVLAALSLLWILNFAALFACALELARRRHRLWATVAIVLNGGFVLWWGRVAVGVLVWA